MGEGRWIQANVFPQLGQADPELLATQTQILTSDPELLTPAEVTTAAQIANDLLLSPNTTEVPGGSIPRRSFV